MTFFCPQCWKEIAPGAEECPHCGTRLADEDARPFVEKLRAALRHREPETAVRAAWILGERGEKKAVEDLTRVLEQSEDGFKAEAAAEALGKIGDARGLAALERAAASGPVRVRRASRQAIAQIRRRADAGSREEL